MKRRRLIVCATYLPTLLLAACKKRMPAVPRLAAPTSWRLSASSGGAPAGTRYGLRAVVCYARHHYSAYVACDTTERTTTTTTVTTVTTATTKRRKRVPVGSAGREEAAEDAAAARAGAEAEAEVSTSTEVASSTSSSTASLADPERLAWAVVDDTAVRLLPGGWEGARADIVRAKAQPSLLFYEATLVAEERRIF